MKFTFSQSLSNELVKSISFQKPNDNISSNLFIGTIGESFRISFDILSGYEYDLYYQIEHCDFNWEKSQLLKSEYLQGFDDVKLKIILVVLTLIKFTLITILIFQTQTQGLKSPETILLKFLTNSERNYSEESL